MHKLAMTLLAAVVVIWMAAKTNVVSYVSVFWTRAKDEVKNQFSTRFEIERVRGEIAKLDKDLDAMITPIAEHKADAARLKREIRKLETNLKDERESLLRLSKELETNPQMVTIEGESFSAERIRRKLDADFESFRRLEKNLESQRKLLDAKESAYQSAQEQLSKLIAKKHEYEVRLARLAADEETLQVTRIGTNVEFDASRANEIEQTLAEIEHRQEVQRAAIELSTGKSANDLLPVRRETGVSPASVRQYLESGNIAQR